MLGARYDHYWSLLVQGTMIMITTFGLWSCWRVSDNNDIAVCKVYFLSFSSLILVQGIFFIILIIILVARFFIPFIIILGGRYSLSFLLLFLVQVFFYLYYHYSWCKVFFYLFIIILGAMYFLSLLSLFLVQGMDRYWCTKEDPQMQRVVPAEIQKKIERNAKKNLSNRGSKMKLWSLWITGIGHPSSYWKGCPCRRTMIICSWCIMSNICHFLGIEKD